MYISLFSHSSNSSISAHIIQRNVDYTGVGQRFSWRMKIMYKESMIEYFIVDKISQQKYSVDIYKNADPNAI